MSGLTRTVSYRDITLMMSYVLDYTFISHHQQHADNVYIG